jgi:hypothetical protein
VSSFALATAVEPLGDGAWLATCDGGWSTRMGPNASSGGFFEEDGELWSRDGALLAQSRRLALLVEGRG